MLFNFLKCCYNKKIFEHKRIGDFEDVSDNSVNTVVIDFDKAKDLYYKGRRTPKSVDGLKILFSPKKFDLIEFKRFQEYFQKVNPTMADAMNKISNFDLDVKFFDSIKLLDSLINDCRYRKIDVYRNATINYIILTDLDILSGPNRIASNLSYISTLQSRVPLLSSIGQKLKSELKTVSCPKLIFLSFKDIDNYYKGNNPKAISF